MRTATLCLLNRIWAPRGSGFLNSGHELHERDQESDMPGKDPVRGDVMIALSRWLRFPAFVSILFFSLGLQGQSNIHTDRH